MVKVKDLIDFISPQSVLGSRDKDIVDITQDSREAGDSIAFLAREGFETDGHKYIEDAYQKGSRVFFVEKIPEFIREDALYIKLSDTAGALGDLAAEVHGHPEEDLDIYGVTGTNGKTTTCYILYDLFNKMGDKSGLMGTIKIDTGEKQIKSDRTTPGADEIFRQLASMRQSGCGKAVMEISSHALDLNRVEALEFSAAVLTNISQDHLNFHRSMEEYLRTKLSIFELLKRKEGRGYYNADDERITRAISNRDRDFQDLFSFSLINDSDFQGSILSLDLNGVEFELNGSEYFLPIPGKYNIYNAIAALSVLLCEDFAGDKLSEALARFQGVPGRLESVSAGKNLEYEIVVDYAHTPSGMKNVLRTLKQLKPGSITAVFGCGGDRDRSKRPKMGRIALKYADKVIITSDNPRSENPKDIIDDIISDINFSSYNTSWCIEVDREKAIRRAVKEIDAGEIVVIFGKGHENYQELSNERIKFDDKKKALKALQDLE